MSTEIQKRRRKSNKISSIQNEKVESLLPHAIFHRNISSFKEHTKHCKEIVM